MYLRVSSDGWINALVIDIIVTEVIALGQYIRPLTVFEVLGDLPPPPTPVTYHVQVPSMSPTFLPTSPPTTRPSNQPSVLPTQVRCRIMQSAQ